jgi:hypothetical protein
MKMSIQVDLKIIKDKVKVLIFKHQQKNDTKDFGMLILKMAKVINNLFRVYYL